MLALYLILGVLCAAISLQSVQSAPSLNQQWIIVFDAGSSSTRMLQFKFKITRDGDFKILQSEDFTWDTSLAGFDPTNEQEAAQVISNFSRLFSRAQETIISPYRKSTPVFLYATAGLRGLTSETANCLLDLVRRSIAASPFDRNTSRPVMKRVAKISGKKEGFFLWQAVAYLTNNSKDFVVMDMGGGSTQIAFKNSGSEPNSVFAKSFHDFGFDVTLMKFVGAYDVQSGGDNERGIYTSHCLHPNFTAEFTYGPRSFRIAGQALPANSESRFKLCHRRAMALLQDQNANNSLKKIKRLLNARGDQPVFGVVGFYYLTAEIATKTQVPIKNNDGEDAGFTRCKGYALTLDQLKNGAKQLCEKVENVNNPYTPFWCLRASYAVALLESGYGFKANTKFYMCKYLYGTRLTLQQKVKVGWPLGVAVTAMKKITK